MKATTKLMTGLVALDAVLLALSGVFDNDTHGVKWVLGGIGWFGFMATTLVLVVSAVVMLARRARRRGIAEAS